MITGEIITLTIWTFVGKVMSLIFNMLSKFVITFLPRSSSVQFNSVAQSCPTPCDPNRWPPTRLLCPWDFPGNSTGVDCHFLLQGIFPTQRSNLGLPHCRQTLYHLSHQGSPYTTTGKTIALTIWTFVSKVMSLIFNMLSRFIIAFLPKSKCLLILRLQSLQWFWSPQNKICHCFHLK